ncbi:MAG: hypothetical protein IT383_03310 [Deltaproteobacteria bacterium]|nr:hypothetical protein [Deltaproteobacteria bacterium]
MNRLALIVSLLVIQGACKGRDADVGKVPVVEPEPPARTLERRALFGDLPVENRFQDPLITFSGSGWFAFGSGYSWPTSYRRVDQSSPTGTPTLVLPGPENRNGVTALGQLKTARAPLHVESWLGREEGGGDDFSDVDVAVVGLFASGQEDAVSLAIDEASRQVKSGVSWVRFTADLEEGPVGWAYFMAGDNNNETLLLTGAVAVDVPAQAGALLRFAPRRASTERERELAARARERTQELALAPRARPTPPQHPAFGR